MAITENRRMQQLRGKYADLDKSKMLVGEIAVPSDHSPIMKVDVDKYIELVSSEDTEYIEKITAEIEQTLDDVNQLAIDKVGINNSVESDVQTYSSRKIQSMHDEQVESITNQITDQFKVLSGTEIVASDSSSGYATDFSCDGKVEQNGTPTPSTPIAILNSGDCVELMQGGYTTSGGDYTNNSSFVCSKNSIACKVGDIVRALLEKSYGTIAIFYYGDNGYISYEVANNTNEMTATVPNGATHFHFEVGGSSAITPDTVGKVELTINGKYVLQVKSVNKNLYPLGNEPFTLIKSTARTKVFNFTPLKNGTYTVSFKVSKVSLSGNTAGVNIVNKTGTIKTISASQNGIVSGTVTADGISQFFFFVAASEADTATVTISDIQIEYGDTATDYVPHKEHISTILLDEPIRSNLDGSVKDLITCQDGVYGVLRGMRRKVYSSSDLVGVSEKYTNIVYYSLPKPTDILDYGKYSNVKALSDKFIRYTGALDDDSAIGGMIIGAKTTAVWFGFAYGTTLEEAQSIGDIEFVYPLAEPVFEPFADQTPFYNIPTYDGGTTISTTDRLQPQIEVEYPTNRVSGVASEGYAKANALTDKFLTYQFRNVTDMDSLGAYLYVNLPSGVDAKDCTLLVSFCHSTVPYSEMSVANWIYTPLESEMQSSIYTTQGIDSTISIHFPKVTSGYLHANVTVIRNDI